MKNDENITLQEGEDGIRKEKKVEGEKALYSCYPATTVNMYPCRGGSSCELAFCHHRKEEKKGGRSFQDAKAQKVSESSEIRDENKEEKMLRLVENALSCRARGENRQNIIFACFLLHDDTLKKYFTSAHKK